MNTNCTFLLFPLHWTLIDLCIQHTTNGLFRPHYEKRKNILKNVRQVNDPEMDPGERKYMHVLVEHL